jgi:hypothetical protein
VPVPVPMLIILVIVMMMMVPVLVVVVVVMAVIVIVVMFVTMTVSKNALAGHECVICLCCTESMRPTAIAAPKPLSIFTTVTPEAQLVSMPKSAVKPDSAVP